jgi:hypothetical protein
MVAVGNWVILARQFEELSNAICEPGKSRESCHVEELDNVQYCYATFGVNVFIPQRQLRDLYN